MCVELCTAVNMNLENRVEALCGNKVRQFFWSNMLWLWLQKA